MILNAHRRYSQFLKSNSEPSMKRTKSGEPLSVMKGMLSLQRRDSASPMACSSCTTTDERGPDQTDDGGQGGGRSGSKEKEGRLMVAGGKRKQEMAASDC